MSVITHRYRHPQIISATSPSKPLAKTGRRLHPKAPFWAIFKASLWGGVGIYFLTLIGLIPVPFLSYLLIPGSLVVYLSTGLMSGVFAGNSISGSHRRGEVGWKAGYWAGIYNGIVAMFLAALDMLMSNLGQSIVTQFTPIQLEGLLSFGLTPEIIALTGRVFGAMVIYGLLGSLIAALFSAIGGMIYPTLVINFSRSKC